MDRKRKGGKENFSEIRQREKEKRKRKQEGRLGKVFFTNCEAPLNAISLLLLLDPPAQPLSPPPPPVCQ